VRTRLLAAVGALLLSAPARADLVNYTVDFSVGVPWRTNPDVYRTPTNLMLTPGVLVVNWVSAELGLAQGFSQFGVPARFGLRPMVGLYPPAIPVYAKLVIDVDNLNLAGGLPVLTTVGGAIGALLRLGPVRLFLEGDYLPQTVQGTNQHIVELRAGVGVKI